MQKILHAGLKIVHIGLKKCRKTLYLDHLWPYLPKIGPIRILCQSEFSRKIETPSLNE